MLFEQLNRLGIRGAQLILIDDEDLSLKPLLPAFGRNVLDYPLT